MGYLENNPMDFVDLPQGSTCRQEKPRTLSPAEYLKLLELFKPRERLAVQIAGWLGPRRSEDFGLKWQDVDLKRAVVTFRQGFVSERISQLKTEVSRAVMSIPIEVRDSLIAWKKRTPYSSPGDWVFASAATNGRRPLWPDSMLAKYIRPIAEAAGFGKFGWHTFRHSLSAWGKEALKLEETKELLRHSNIQTTMMFMEAYRSPRNGKRRIVWLSSYGKQESSLSAMHAFRLLLLFKPEVRADKPRLIKSNVSANVALGSSSG